MSKYHKIQSVYKRDPETKFSTFLEGQYSIPEFEYLADNEWVWTEKIDGTNIRVYLENANGEDFSKTTVRFEGRTDKAQTPTFLVEELTRLFPPEKFLMFDTDAPVVLYGEGYGAKIQKGGGNYISDGVSFILFDVRVGQWWLERDAVNDLADALGVRYVPTIGTGTLSEAIEFVREGFDSQWGDFESEGIVARPTVELFTRSGHRIITKIKCKDFPK